MLINKNENETYGVKWNINIQLNNTINAKRREKKS